LGDFNVVISTDDCKGVAPNQVSCIDFFDWINNNDLTCMPFLDLIILVVMGGAGYTKLIENWIGLDVMERVWMNEILVIINFLLKIILTTPLFLLVIVYKRLKIFSFLFLCGFKIVRV